MAESSLNSFIVRWIDCRRCLKVVTLLGIFSVMLLVGGCLAPPPLASTQPIQHAIVDAHAGQQPPSVSGGEVQTGAAISTSTPEPDVLQGGIIIQVTRTPSPAPDATDAKISEEPEDGVPVSAFLENVPVGKQTRSLNCEFQSASDLIWYYGFPFGWDEIFDIVGHDPNGNPHVGFVGRSFDDPPGRLYPRGYGVYAEPIARGLKTIGVDAEVHYGESKEWVKEQVANGKPVMVWVTANMAVHPVSYWTAKDGERIKAVRGEHTNLVIGYDEDGVWVADPWDGQRHYYSWPVFLSSWDLLDRMSLVVTGREQASP